MLSITDIINAVLVEFYDDGMIKALKWSPNNRGLENIKINANNILKDFNIINGAVIYYRLEVQ